MKIRPMKLVDKLRARLVDRWQIVRTHKKQSVAEHSFDVALISLEFFDNLWATGGSEWEGKHYADQVRAAVLEWALIHDLPEAITGDFPSPLKKLLDCAPIKELERQLLANSEELLGSIDHRSIAWAIVKCGDYMADIEFLRQDGFGHHAEFVRDRLDRNARAFVDWCQSNPPFSDLDWHVAWRKTYDEMRSEPLYLDHIVG